MVFKLVRTDTEDPCKIQLPLGTHLFGRDKFLDCADKRVSRNHGHLEVTADIVTLKSIHQNPCFYSRKGAEETQILKQSETIDLNNGDRFGLLPDTYWYELLHCTVSPKIDNGAIVNVPGDAENRVENTPSTVADDDSQMEKPTTNDDVDIPIDFELNESIEGSGHNGSQSLISDENPTDEPPSIHNMTTQVPITDSSTQSYKVVDNATSPAKRAHSDRETNCDVKKVKTEAEDDQPGTSDANGQQGCSSTDNVKAEPPSPTKPPQPAPAPAPALRERCYYGVQCYRRNPQHKAQFSHPADPDWGSGPRTQCPHGAACRKRDARHWRDHDHPQGTAPPNPPGRRNRSPISGGNSDDSREPSPRPPTKKKSRKVKGPSYSGSESDSEDTPATNLIMTGKRARKPVRRPSYAGSESGNEDPYATDGSDDWAPPSDCTNSQDHTQTQDF